MSRSQFFTHVTSSGKSDLFYSYRNDQELIDLRSITATTPYCLKNVITGDGTKNMLEI